MPTVQKIIEVCEEAYRLKPGTILKKNKHAKIVKARMLAIYLIQVFHPKKSYTNIGRIFGTSAQSIHYCLKNVDKKAPNDAELQNMIDILARKLIA